MILLSKRMHTRPQERGNILFIILLSVALIGLLTVAISGSNTTSNDIDNETLILRTSEVQRYAKQLERAVQIVMEDAVSEVDLRFAHPDASSDYGALSDQPNANYDTQIFSASGGAAQYQGPPSGINDGSAWEFYAGTAIPGIGTSKADLVAVLPNVTEDFCTRVNELNDQSAIPDDTGTGAAAANDSGSAGDCVYMGANGRFDAGVNYYDTPNTMDETTFEQDTNISQAFPAPQACVLCERDSQYHFYHVLLAR